MNAAKELPAANRLDLRACLERKPFLENGKHWVQYPGKNFDFRQAVEAYIREKSGLKKLLPLEQVHKSLPPESLVPVKGSLNLFSGPLNETNRALVDTYYRFIGFLSQTLGFDFVFETNPTLRLHFPVKAPDRFRSREGKLLTYHSDTLLESPFEEINCWLPLTHCEGNASLQIADLQDSIKILDAFCQHLNYDSEKYLNGRMLFFEFLRDNDILQKSVLKACKPLPINFGEMIVFDSRTIHGTGENDTDSTRISIDFRIIPLKQYESLLKKYEKGGGVVPVFEGKPIKQGGFYHLKTAREL